MPYILRGNLWGYICRECPRPLWGVVVRVYAAEGERLIERAVADPKATTAAVDEKEVKARAGRLLGEAKVGEDGAFEVSFDRKANYKGGPVDIDMRVESLAHLDERAPKAKPRQIHITTLQPAWRERGDELVFYWEYYLHWRLWCLILSWFGLWVICGRVTVCETGAPVVSVRVNVWDADIWEDDSLGSAVTDATGRFVLYYTTADFAYSPWWNDEIYHGPDLYFEVKTLSGQSLLAEPRSRARQPDRENVGTCFCVSLCLEDQAPVNEPLPLFTHIGGLPWADPAGAIHSALGGSGLTSDHRAFYSTLRLNGMLPKTLNGNAMEYMFEYRTTDAAGNPTGGWLPVTPAMMAGLKIGMWQAWNYSLSAMDWKNCVVKGTPGTYEMAPVINGNWIQVPQFSNTWDPLEGNFQPNGNMIALISSSLASFPSLNMASKVAGSSTGPTFAANKHFSLRMVCREVVNTANVYFGAGELQHIAVNNHGYDNIKHHLYWAGFTDPPGTLGVNLLGIGELEVNGCAKITNALTVKITAAHPTLGAVSLSLIGGNAGTVQGGGAATFTLPAATPDERFGVATNNFNPANLSPCAYILTMRTQLLLTTGDYHPNDLVDQIAFAK